MNSQNYLIRKLQIENEYQDRVREGFDLFKEYHDLLFSREGEKETKLERMRVIELRKYEIKDMLDDLKLEWQAMGLKLSDLEDSINEDENSPEKEDPKPLAKMQTKIKMVRKSEIGR